MIIRTPIYNEMPWTPFFLKHLLEYDCPIFIGEGASDVFHGSPRSTDGSLELITRFAEVWKDRVTVIPHDYSQRGKSHDKYRPRELIKKQIWDSLVDGEWMINLAADNFYSSDGIRKLKDIIREVSKNKKIYNILTEMKVFMFNFNTTIIRPNIGLCGWWYSLWPCIYKKNSEYTMVVGDELLYAISHGTVRHGNRIGMIRDKFELRKIQREFKTDNPHLYITKEITNFHYKGLKPLYKSKARQKKSVFEHVKNFPLEHEDLIKYEGLHPKVLDTHPWRKIDDCRKVESSFDYRDFMYLVEK